MTNRVRIFELPSKGVTDAETDDETPPAAAEEVKPLFTREDVRRHRVAAKEWEKDLMVLGAGVDDFHPHKMHTSMFDQAAWHYSMADRIESLLPPEEKDGA